MLFNKGNLGYKKKMKNVKETMAVANEVLTKEKQNLDDLKSAKRKLINWLF